jgi:hypothetical protein
MSALFPVLMLITYLSICYQDFKIREVYLVTYSILYALFLFAVLTNRIFLNIDFVIVNSCILIAVTCLLVMYYLVRYRQTSLSILRASVGWGDVLMLPAFVINFSPLNLIIVFMLSLLVALIYHVGSNFWSQRDRTIPLAGIQSLVLSVILMADSLGFLKMQYDFFLLF